MPPDMVAANPGVAIEDVLEKRTGGMLSTVLGNQAMWVTVALIVLVAVMSWLQPQAFASTANLYNITRNFSFFGIMALGMTTVIITGGIDLSVGSMMGAIAIIAGTIMHADLPWWLAVIGALASGVAFGLFNGAIVAIWGLPSFVVTLGSLLILRSLAIVLSRNKMIYEFGSNSDFFFNFGGGSWLGVATPVWILLIMAIGLAIVLNGTVWGRHLYAVGGNENAARLTGIPVTRVKIEAYVFSAVCATIAALLSLAWQGSAINALGQGYELKVIAGTVVGGADLMGGIGGAYGAVVGSAFLEVIRNSLLMAGVDFNYQGIFDGAFIILAVLLSQVRRRQKT